MAQFDNPEMIEIQEDEHDVGWYLKRLVSNPLYMAFLLGFFVLFIFFKDIVMQVNVFLMMILFGGLVFLLIKSLDWLLKSMSPVLIVNQMKTTTMGKPITRVWQFDVWSMGDIMAWNVHWRGSDGTVFLPYQARNDVGRCIIYPVRVWRYNFYSELPYEMQRCILQHGLPKDKVYIGLIDDTQADDDITMSDVIPELKKYKETLDDKVLEKITRLEKVPAKYLASLFLDMARLRNASHWAYVEASGKMQSMAGDMRRIGDTREKSTTGKAIEFLMGQGDEKK